MYVGNKWQWWMFLSHSFSNKIAWSPDKKTCLVSKNFLNFPYIMCIYEFWGMKHVCNSDLPPCTDPVTQFLEFLSQIQIWILHCLDADYWEGSCDTNGINEATYIFLKHTGLHLLLQLKTVLWNQYICTCNVYIIFFMYIHNLEL